MQLWSIAFLLGSQAALSVALFQHAYIWVHYSCTEEPDMRLLYGWTPAATVGNRCKLQEPGALARHLAGDQVIDL